VLGTVTRFSENNFVFTTSGKTRMGGFSKFKARFDGLMFNELRKMVEERGDDPAKVTLDRWTVHDLRLPDLQSA
jgi:hypothetical protein